MLYIKIKSFYLLINNFLKESQYQSVDADAIIFWIWENLKYIGLSRLVVLPPLQGKGLLIQHNISF